MSGGAPVVVLVVAAGADWESPAMTRLNDAAGIVVLKRCVDVDDLLAAAAVGQADVAVVGLDAPGLDRSAVDHLRSHDVHSVVVVPLGVEPDAARARAERIGAPALVPEAELERLPVAVVSVVSAPPQPSLPDLDAEEDTSRDLAPGEPGRVVVVWGGAGAPGRTTLAVGLAAVLADRSRAVLVDADPHAASVAQQLGILDEVSGLLQATRLAGSGALDDGFGSVLRGVGHNLAVVTGLPRPDRWLEVRPGTIEHLVETARRSGHVVVDTGFSLEEDQAADFGTRPGRNQMTHEAIQVADDLVVVGSADPVGLARLARSLVEVRDRAPGAAVHVVVNRMRPSLGWSEREVAGMVGGFTRLTGLHFLPDDRAAVDRAAVSGRTLVETGDSSLLRAVAEVADAIVGRSEVTRRRWRRRRRTA